jgi:hypothetical protein
MILMGRRLPQIIADKKSFIMNSEAEGQNAERKAIWSFYSHLLDYDAWFLYAVLKIF